MPRWFALAVLLALLVASCAGGRSAEAFCQTLESENARLSQKYELRSDQLEDEQPLVALLASVGSLVEAQGDYVVMMGKLEGVAPDQIRSEMEVLRDAAQKQADATASGDLSEILLGGLITMGQVQGAASTVDQFIAHSCR